MRSAVIHNGAQNKTVATAIAARKRTNHVNSNVQSINRNVPAPRMTLVKFQMQSREEELFARGGRASSSSRTVGLKLSWILLARSSSRSLQAWKPKFIYECVRARIRSENVPLLQFRHA